MEILLRVEVGTGAGELHADLRADLDGDATVAALAGAICEHLGLASERAPLPLARAATGELLAPDQTVAGVGLLSGETLLLGATEGAPARAVPETGVTVDVLAGPDAGSSTVIVPGRFVLGRDPGCDIVLRDPTVSASHAWLEVMPDRSVVVVPSPAAANGVLVDGASITAPTAIGPETVTQLGASAIVVRPFRRGRSGALDQLGQVPFHRTPYRPSIVVERRIDALGDVPCRPEPSRFAFFSAVLPLAAGLTMYAFSQQPQFLALTALTPLSVAGNWWEQRQRGSQRYSAAVERFRRRVTEREREVRAALADERVRRVRGAPDVADLARRAELRTVDLWARGRTAPDFLSLRVGLGDVASRIVVEIERGGDEDWREHAHAAAAGHDVLVGVPVCMELAELGVVALRGDPADVSSLAGSLVLQGACLHSPEDLVVAGAVAPERDVAAWLKWLPHTRSATSPLAGAHLAHTRAAAERLLRAIVEVADLRLGSADRTIDRRWPWMLLVLDEEIASDPALVSQLLDRCPAAGISVVWITDSDAKIVRQAAGVVHCEPVGSGRLSTLWFANPEREITKLEPERLNPEVAERVARALAPVRDASVASATTAIPRVVPLFTAFGVDDVSPEWVAANWRTDPGYALAAPIGTKADGPFVLDLVGDGPHVLIAGTSGAGKSELLQSIVASLIAHYPPNRLNFLFVDYKGGASSTVFRGVPHTVGYVTNLDAALSRRALTSLRAELDRRMRLLEGRAKDLREMLEKHPDEAPPSLVIVVDEFATLVREVEGFVDGIVDIAQRGRSLGIHLVLATQRPSGSVNDNILANTNLRISLRVLDSAESASIIGSPEAAEIPLPLKGRGYARLGPRELVAFQSAFAGARLGPCREPRAVTVGDFTSGGGTHDRERPLRLGTSSGDERSQVEVLVDAVRAAAAHLGLERGREPWREMLPDHITLESLRADERCAGAHARPGRTVAVGLVDAPERQDQYPALVDLEDGGGLLVFGGGGSGKTTALRTIAASAVLDDADGGGDNVVIFGIDFASRALRSLEALPHCATVATGDDLESVTRVIKLLDDELDRRRDLLARRQADSLTSWNLLPGRHRLPRVLLLVDGYANLAAAFTSPAPGDGPSSASWLDTFHRLVVEGRQVGIHAVLTADRRAAVPGQLMSAVANRLVLRQSDDAGYADLGVAGTVARAADLVPGRGFLAGDLLQVACVALDGHGAAQAAALAELGAELRADVPAELRTEPLEDRVVAVGVRVPPMHVVVGRADVTRAPVVVDLRPSNLLVAGPARSGRSTALLTVAGQLGTQGADVWMIGNDTSPLCAAGNAERSAFGASSDVLPMLEELVAATSVPRTDPCVLAIDDLDLLDDPLLTPPFQALARNRGVRVLASVETRALTGYAPDPMLSEMRRARRMLLLQPDSALDVFTVTGVRAPLRTGTPMPRGRGVLIVDREAVVLQVALPEC